MLKGKLIYQDEDFGQVEYDIVAKDSFDDLKLYLINSDFSNIKHYQNASMVFDKHVSYPSDSTDEVTYTERTVHNPYEASNPSDNRRLDIQKSSKFKTNLTNYDFCARVSALVRYAQVESRKHYNNELVNPEDYFDTQRVITLQNVGYIKYEMGLIHEIAVQSPYVKLHLIPVDENLVQSGLFKTLKEKNNYGQVISTTPIANKAFKLQETLLGFPYTPPMEREAANLFGMYETIEDVIESQPDKNTAWILSRDYHIVTDETLESVMAEFMAHQGYVAFDTETSGLKINFKSRTGEGDQLVGVVLSIKKGSGYYFPLQHKAFKNLCDGDHWFFMEHYMKPLLEQKKIIAHNLQFDWKVAYIYGINANIVYDTMLAFGVTKRYEDPTFQYGLKALARNLLGLDMFDLSDFVIGGSFGDSDITFADLPYELVRQYAPADADITLSIFEYLEYHAILDKYEAHSVFEMEVNFAKAVSYSEFFGYHVNVDKIPSMRDTIVGNMDKYKEEMFSMAGGEFNPNSPPQLLKIMYDDLGIEKINPEKPSTNKETLNALVDRTNADGEVMYPFVKSLKNYRDNEGIFKNFLKKLHIFSTEDGYIFPEVQQLGTNTGRSSIKNPNYQGYNDPVKQNIVPRPGYFHFDCDFSQIEYRVLASMAQQEQLMAEFDDPDLDYHTYQAARMFSIPYSQVSKALRGQSKGINFGLPYGMGDSSLGARIFGERTKENQAKATVLRRKFFQGQEKIEMFFERVRAEGVANGYTKTHFGRRRYYQKAKFSENEIRRQAGNHVIQGTAADIYKISCNRMFNRVVDEGWLGLVIFNAFVHDELLMEVHKSINPYYFFKAWREEFELSIDGFCKLFAGAGIGYSWYDAKKQDLPPQYIEKIINHYEANPDMEWDEDFDSFFEDIEQGYADYKTDRVKEYIQDPANDGEIIKPIIYSLLVEVSEGIIKAKRKDPFAHKLISELNQSLIEDGVSTDHPETGKPQDLIPLEGKHKIKTLKQYLGVFGHYYDMKDKIRDVKSADESASSQQSHSSDQNSNQQLLSPMTFEDDSFSMEDFVELRGYYQDEVNDIIYFKDVAFTYEGIPTTMINYLYTQGCFMTEGKHQLALYNPETKESTLYKAYISEANYQRMIKMYATLNRLTMKFTPQVI